MSLDKNNTASLPNLKKEHSYTYWVDHKNKSKELPLDQRPKKIQNPNLIIENSKVEGPSQWNTLGTWEQKNINLKDIEKDVIKVLTQWLQEKQNSFNLKKVQLQGQAHIIYVRKEKRLQYEISGSIQFESEKRMEIKIVELNDQGDKQFKIKSEIQKQKQWLTINASQIIQEVQQTIRKYKS